MGDVWLHIYHCDPYTGFLNQAILKQKEIGIYHAGIEVFGEEWSFGFFEDTWDDPSISGLTPCTPKSMAGYEYQESVNLGPTPLSEDETDLILRKLYIEWPASSYHLTHRNCLVFAEDFARILQAPAPFPAHLQGILKASTQHAFVDAIVDHSWSWAKWWMLRKHKQPCIEEERDNGGVWATICHPTQACSTAQCIVTPSWSSSQEGYPSPAPICLVK